MARLSIRVQPRASMDEVLDRIDDGTLRVRVTAPPEDGKANAAVVKLLAKKLGVARSSVRVVSGHSSRNKVIEVDGMSESDLRRRL